MSALPKVTLSIVEGPDAGRSVELRKAVTTLGKKGADLELRDPRISSLHATFEIAAGAVLVVDNSSKGGVKVNGERVSSRELKNLDEIEIGSNRIRISLGGASKGEKQTQPKVISSMIDEELHRFSKWEGGASRYGLEVVQGPEAGRRIALDRPKMTLGRGRSDISFRDRDVSRSHATIEVSKEGIVMLRDLGSTNGTFANSKRVTESRISIQDRIQIGGTVMVLVERR